VVIFRQTRAEEGYTLDQFRARLAEYDHIDKAQLRENMAYFPGRPAMILRVSFSMSASLIAL
jgi:hypothetical protein